MQEIRSIGALALVLAAVMAAPAAPQDVRTLIQRSVEANQRDWNVAPDYSYFERVQNGGGATKTSHVLMIQGSLYEELTAVNGRPLSAEEQAAEERKLDAVIAQRREESPKDRAERIAKYKKDRNRGHLMMEQLSEAFDFKLQGSQKLNGFDVYVLQATPRPGYSPPNLQTEALKGMQGRLWIDQKTFQWVKVEAKVVHPVSIEGFFARVEPGTRFELEEMPVEDGVWLPKHFSMKSRARILLLFPNKRQEDDVYYDYEKEAR